MCYLYVWTNEAIVSEIKLFYSILYSILHSTKVKFFKIIRTGIKMFTGIHKSFIEI